MDPSTGRSWHGCRLAQGTWARDAGTDFRLAWSGGGTEPEGRSVAPVGRRIGSHVLWAGPPSGVEVKVDHVSGGTSGGRFLDVTLGKFDGDGIERLDDAYGHT